jgi:hypothetical protein
MKHPQIPLVAILWLTVQGAFGTPAPSGLVSRVGDQSIVLHWDSNQEKDLAGYRLYRSLQRDGTFVLQNRAPLTSPGFCDLSLSNGQTAYYRVTAVSKDQRESAPSASLAATPRAFTNDDEFLEYVQQTSFDYFWYAANPANGLVPDRSAAGSPCSIAAVGFGLTALGIGVDHGWISREQAVQRVLRTLDTFLSGPQGSQASGRIGYKGWFYHFLDMQSAVRYTRFNTELSSIDTALLLAGVLYVRQYFDGNTTEESALRAKAQAIFDRVDWNWMARGTDVVSMGWLPDRGFLASNWVGYNEGMILYCLGLGAATNPLPASAWARWTSGYHWTTNYGLAFLRFPALFVHQYSHCWIDYRQIADAYMNSHNCDYFENSRRATLAQRAYCIANPFQHTGYGSNVWGLTASDGFQGYAVHGAPPADGDDGTIAPTAATSSIPFTPDYSLAAMRHFYSQYRTRIWTEYGFRDAFNLGKEWWGPDVLGIDQGPIVIMIENYRSQRPWQRFMSHEAVKRGLGRAGFAPAAVALQNDVTGDASHGRSTSKSARSPVNRPAPVAPGH